MIAWHVGFTVTLTNRIRLIERRTRAYGRLKPEPIRFGRCRINRQVRTHAIRELFGLDLLLYLAALVLHILSWFALVVVRLSKMLVRELQLSGGNSPLCISRQVCAIFSREFITKGPDRTMGSLSGWPAASSTRAWPSELLRLGATACQLRLISECIDYRFMISALSSSKPTIPNNNGWVVRVCKIPLNVSWCT